MPLNKLNIIYYLITIILLLAMQKSQIMLVFQIILIKGIKIKIITSLINNLKHLVIPFDPSES